MLNKKLLILIIFFVSLLVVSAVSAADNVTSDVISVNETTDDIVNLEETTDAISISDNVTDDIVNVNDCENDGLGNNQDNFGSSEFQNEISLNNDAAILYSSVLKDYPSYSDYDVSISDTIIYPGFDWTIIMNITPAKRSISYKYYYYFKVYDSNNNEKISQLYSGTNSPKSIYYTYKSGKLISGTYTMKIINFKDNHIMSTAKLTIGTYYPSHSSYSVHVNDTIINYDSNGSILMSIAPTKYSEYKYYYYLNVYDLDNNLKISHLYYSNSATYPYCSKEYKISSNQLNSGIYTIKIINYNDYYVMSTAKLIVKSPTYPSYLDYSISISDISIDYGSSGSIFMGISPAKNINYKYYYYLNVYDSKDNVKISKLYSSTYSDNSKIYTLTDHLSSGTYTVKIINYFDKQVMDTAKLTVMPSSTYPYYNDYNVSVSDISIDYGSSGSIFMGISPAKGSNYKYYYYLAVYDSNNNPEIYQKYYSTNYDYSETYCISANQLSSGTYSVEIINYYDNKVIDTAKLIVKKIKTQIIAENINMNCGSNQNIIVTLKDSNGNLISGKSLIIKINGKNYRGSTDKNGRAYIKVPKLVPKKYQASIKFAGDSKYAEAYESITVVVKPITKITVKNRVGKEGKKIKLTAIVEDGLGKKIKKGKVAFKIKGKIYSVNIKKGVATIKIKCPKAKYNNEKIKIKGKYKYETSYFKSTYTCVVTYHSHGKYPSGSSTFKVTSKGKPIKHKYRIYKYRTYTLPVKNALKFYHKGSVVLAVGMKYLSTKNKLIVGVGDDNDHPIKFKVKKHYKKNGKWRWDNWFYCDEDHYMETIYGKAIKIDKVKINCYSPYLVKIY